MRTVRALSDFTIRGDAWTWWASAAGEYARDQHPMVGSVLVFKRTSHLRRGHVSLVSGVIDRRTITVDHTWSDGRTIRRGMKVVDVSPRNDWSEVRVWHTPTSQLGERGYPTYGFILPEGAKPWSDVIRVADHGANTASAMRYAPSEEIAVAPAGRRPHRPVTEKAENAERAAGRVLVPAAFETPARKPRVERAASAGTPKATKPATRSSAAVQPPKRKPPVKA